LSLVFPTVVATAVIIQTTSPGGGAGEGDNERHVRTCCSCVL
jgi:hypothetical protein